MDKKTKTIIILFAGFCFVGIYVYMGLWGHFYVKAQNAACKGLGFERADNLDDTDKYVCVDYENNEVELVSFECSGGLWNKECVAIKKDRQVRFDLDVCDAFTVCDSDRCTWYRDFEDVKKICTESFEFDCLRGACESENFTYELRCSNPKGDFVTCG